MLAMKIEVFKHLKIFDAGSKAGVDAIIKKISIDSNIMTLNLSRCIIDYPSTSNIIDAILNKLQRQPAERVLIIQTHLNVIEPLLMHWLFIGSEFLKIDDSKKKISREELISVVNKNLIVCKTKIIIQVINKADEVIKEYKYGS